MRNEIWMDCEGRNISLKGSARAGQLIQSFLEFEILNYLISFERTEEITHIRFPSNDSAILAHLVLAEHLKNYGYKVNSFAEMHPKFFSEPASCLIH